MLLDLMFTVPPLDVVAHSTITCPSTPMSHGATRPMILRLQTDADETGTVVPASVQYIAAGDLRVSLVM